MLLYPVIQAQSILPLFAKQVYLWLYYALNVRFHLRLAPFILIYNVGDEWLPSAKRDLAEAALKGNDDIESKFMLFLGETLLVA